MKWNSIIIAGQLMIGCTTPGYAHTSSADTTKIQPRPKKETIIQNAPAIAIAKGCEKIYTVNVIIEEAIAVGASIYNAGNHEACYLIYEGAAYKILHKYGSKCKQVNNILEAALEKAYIGNYNATDKAWIMRMAFDRILGVPTTTTTN